MTCRKAGTWDKFFYFTSGGRHAEDFYVRKIQRLQPDLNLQTWVPEASMLTTRPPKPSMFDYILPTYFVILYNKTGMSHLKGITTKFLIYDFIHTLLSPVPHKTQPNQLTCINNQTNIQKAPPPGCHRSFLEVLSPLHYNGVLNICCVIYRELIVLLHFCRIYCPASFLSN